MSEINGDVETALFENFVSSDEVRSAIKVNKSCSGCLSCKVFHLSYNTSDKFNAF